MFTQLMRESRIYGHNKGHLDSCSKCKAFKAEFEKKSNEIDMEKFNVMVEYEKNKIKSYKEDCDIYLGYKLQSKYYINNNFADDINVAVPFNILINRDNLTQFLLEKLDSLPDKFVIKKNKLSGNTIVVDKVGGILFKETRYKYSTSNLYEILTTVLRYDYDKNPENNVTDKMDLFVEEHIEVKEEYKFHCLHGKVVMIEHYMIGSGLYNNKWYTRNWQELDLTGRDDPYPFIVYPNKEYYKYIRIAEKIAASVKLDYIRVDTFTDNDDTLFFGELSHSPNAFHNNYSPSEFDELLYKLYTKDEKIEDLETHMSKFLVFNKVHDTRKNNTDTNLSTAEGNQDFKSVTETDSGSGSESGTLAENEEKSDIQFLSDFM